VAWLLLGVARSIAAAFPEPPGGWTYMYAGDQLQVGDPLALDGTWDHGNGSDAWDGSEIGNYSMVPGLGFGTKNAPGGASLGTQSDVSYLRMQDCGDPRDYDDAGQWDDPQSRKIYFGHDLTGDGVANPQTIMDDGVTLTFRARIPTLAKAGPPLDPLYRDGQQAAGVQPYPDDGDGYVTSDGGKGNFVIYQDAGGDATRAGGIAFSFTQTTDTTTGNPTTGKAGFAGLTFNEFNGNVPSAGVNFGQGTKTNVVAFDPTDWHELYIVLRKDPANIGTHEAFIFRDGNLTPSVFKMTAGTGKDIPFGSFLAMGGSATPQNWALDVDWFGYKDTAVFPPGAKLPPSLFDFAPANQAMFQPAAGGLKFSASSLMPGGTLPKSGFKALVNGQDVSSQLALTGSDTSASRTATFSGLEPNTVYAATYIVTDSIGLGTTNEITFDTFVEAQAKIVEAEDYNHSSGQFIDNPTPGAYAGQVGTIGVDFADTSPASMGTYRPSDAVDTAVTADVARAAFVNAGVQDQQIGAVAGGEWWNYTRTLPAGNYHAYLRTASSAAQQVRLDRVTSEAGQANQVREFLGTFAVPRTGNLNVFSYIPLADANGKPIALPLSGQTTLRLTSVNANADLALNFLLLIPAGATPTDPRVSTSPVAFATGVAADVAIEAAIYDGTSPVDRNTVKLRMNGTEVPVVVTQSGTLTAVKYTPASLLAPATAYSVNLTFNDGTARSVDWSFTTANYPVLTPTMKVANARTPGLVWRMFQNEANQETSIQRAEDALAGRLKDGTGEPLPNYADPAVWGPASADGSPAAPGAGTMTFKIPTYVNVSQTESTSFGNFVPDEQMPGIPGVTGSTDGIAVEITTFIELPRGFITMGVNSDDGFQTTAGFLKDAPLVLGGLNGGRGAGDTLFRFAVEEAGTYAFRTLYFEGGGDASVEWFIVNADGTRSLINDTANGGRRSYQEGTVPDKPIENVTLTIRQNASGTITLEWIAGTLQAADTVKGTYQTVSGAQSPWTVTPAGAQKFYRVQVR
jgi:hypothetical protein